MVVKAVRHKKIIHKRTKKFTRFECEDFPHKLKPNWRRPRGLYYPYFTDSFLIFRY